MNILISGARGYIGSYLTKLALEKGHTVYTLSRNKSSDPHVFHWDIPSTTIDPEVIEQVDAVIHLAGESIGARWTNKRKKAIQESRVQGTALLVNAISKAVNKPKVFISASATGFYGAVTSEHIYTEEDDAAQDFLGQTTSAWEKEIHKVKKLGLRTVILRTGIVVSKDSKALQKMMMPVKMGVGASLGTGKQFFPWIHLHDMAAMYLFALENPISGIFNAVAPEHISYEDVNRSLAKVLKRPLFLPSIPEFFLRLVLGEMAVLLTRGSRVSADKIQKEGFIFLHTNFKKMLSNEL
jgi:uncharacterized protein (TIGR01777 family)